MAIQVNVLDAKTNLSALIAKVLEGEQVTIARAGTPVVDLIIQLNRHDPFDRMILAQAAARQHQLYTSDATLLGLGLPYVYDCRR